MEDDSIVDLKDKEFIKKLNYLVKKQKKIDKIDNDCFINIKLDDDQSKLKFSYIKINFRRKI